jgi:hypothetical protein
MSLDREELRTLYNDQATALTIYDEELADILHDGIARYLHSRETAPLYGITANGLYLTVGGHWNYERFRAGAPIYPIEELLDLLEPNQPAPSTHSTWRPA